MHGTLTKDRLRPHAGLRRGVTAHVLPGGATPGPLPLPSEGGPLPAFTVTADTGVRLEGDTVARGTLLLATIDPDDPGCTGRLMLLDALKQRHGDSLTALAVVRARDMGQVSGCCRKCGLTLTVAEGDAAYRKLTEGGQQRIYLVQAWTIRRIWDGGRIPTMEEIETELKTL